MLAKKIVFFLWGAAFASLWWFIGTGPDTEGALFLKVVGGIVGTALTLIGGAVNAVFHWDDKG